MHSPDSHHTMAQSQRRRSNRIAAYSSQTEIVGIRGQIGFARVPNNNRRSARRSSAPSPAPTTLQTKALAIDHGPPWSLSELKGKYKIALKSMVRAHNLVAGHDPKKQDLVKLLWDYGQQQQQQQQQQEPHNNDNQLDPGKYLEIFLIKYK